MTDAKRSEGGTVKTGEGAAVEYMQYRYWTRILKGSALPILYTVVSVFMLRNYSLHFPNYFEYDILFISLGIVLGLLTVTGLTATNLLRAKKKAKKGAKLDQWIVLAVYLPILLVVMVIALFLGLSTMWQFSIGFFGTMVVPPLLVLLFETAFKGRFFVREYERPIRMKDLVLIPTTTG